MDTELKYFLWKLNFASETEPKAHNISLHPHPHPKWRLEITNTEYAYMSSTCATFVARPATVTILYVLSGHVLVFHGERFQIPVLIQCHEMWIQVLRGFFVCLIFWELKTQKMTYKIVALKQLGGISVSSVYGASIPIPNPIQLPSRTIQMTARHLNNCLCPAGKPLTPAIQIACYCVQSGPVTANNARQ